MDPGREAMISGWKPDEKSKDIITSPRRDPNTRISKSKKKPAAPRRAKGAGDTSKYLTLDQQSEKFIAEEDKFVLKQSKKKADIRVRENRAKPIDFLAFNLRFVDTDRDVFDDDDADVEIEVPTPEAVLEGLNDAQLKELEEEINSYLTLESNGRNKDYWRALLALCDDRRQKLKPQGPEGRAVNSVSADIDGILSPKTYEQLEALEKQIKAKLQSDEPIDTDYWEDLLKSLLVWKARARVRRICTAVRQARIEYLKARDPVKAKILEEGGRLGPLATAASDDKPQKRRRGATTKPQAVKPAPGLPAPSTSAPPKVEAQGPSTVPPPGTERFASMGNEDFSQATKALYDREVARGVGEGEEIFQAEEALPGATKPLWADKYRPRKPRYFNRVQMGYEWNKYNQTHYDHDNPPPKVVQGYKFNIFYPDLIDKTRAPTFKIIREHGRRKGESFAPAGEEDTCLIRFIAGPPYQDIAFRIVDREWDFSAKKERGFRSTFDRGILQLHFQFKKIYYRK